MDMIKNHSYDLGIDETSLREDFVNKFCQLMGWDKNNLTLEQVHEIKQQPEYKAPAMIKG